MKLTRFFIMLFVVMLLAACSDNNDQNQDTEESANEESGIEVDKGLLNVEITLPASLVGEEGMEDFEASVKETVDSDITLNDDGSVTVKMSKSDHKKMLEELKEEFVASVDSIIEDESFVTIQDITYNKDLTNIQMIVSDQESFENSFDGFATLSLGIGSLFYQAFDGKDLTKNKITIEIVDQSTNETIHEIIYPDVLDEMGEEE